MPVTTNMEISLGAVLSIISMIVTVAISFTFVRANLVALTERFSRSEIGIDARLKTITDTIQKLDDRMDRYGDALAIIAVQKVQIEGLERQINEIRNEVGRNLMFQPIVNPVKP